MRAARAFACLAAAAGLVAVACGSFSADDPPTATPEGGPGSDAAPLEDAPPEDVAVREPGVDACAALDLTRDPKNCGACGHDCLGGRCLAGSCQPVQIAVSTNSVTAVTATDGAIFWLSKNDVTVHSCPLVAGCSSPPPPLATLVSTPFAIAPLGGDVAVATPIDIEKVSAGGGITMISTGYGGLLAMDTDGKGAVYVIGSMPSVKLFRVDVAKGQTSALLTNDSLVSLAFASDRIFYYAKSGTEVFGVCTAPGCTDAGALATATMEGPTVVQLAATKGGLFWNRPPSGPVESCALPSCALPTKLVSTLGDVGAVAADDTYFYYAAPAAGQVLRCPHAGCGAAPTTLATGTSPHALVVVGGALYWATDSAAAGGSAAIWRIAL